MRHARQDYNRIQDPEGKIGEDEPVMLFRAQDRHMVAVLTMYGALLTASKNLRMADRVLKFASGDVRDWQLKHGTKEPDL